VSILYTIFSNLRRSRCEEDAYPYIALNIQASQFPFCFAAEGGHTEASRWLMRGGCPREQHRCVAAAKSGDADVSLRFDGRGCFVGPKLGVWHDRFMDWGIWSCAEAAAGGHLDALKWPRRKGLRWDCSACSLSAGNGHLEVSKWLTDNGCPWDLVGGAFAATKGQMAVLKWSIERGCPCDDSASPRAVGGGHLDVLRWLKGRDCALDSNACSIAADG
jgi:hypothetical protein